MNPSIEENSFWWRSCFRKSSTLHPFQISDLQLNPKVVHGMETEDGGATHPNVDNGTRVGHDGAGAGSGADAGDLPGGELDLLGELVGGSCQDLQLLGQCCCCCWLEDPQLLLGPHGLRNGSCWWSFQVQASKPASLLHTSMHL